MSEEKPQVTPYAVRRLLAWIHDRAMETTEKGSIYIGIEKGRITWVNYEKSNRFAPLAESSSAGIQGGGSGR